MKFVVSELKASALTQVVTPEVNTIVTAIRPHIYRHNFATGNLQLQIIDDTSAVIATSESIAISSITGLAYYHGYVRFYINAYLQAGRNYTISLSGQSGYSFAEGAYCGWVSGLDLGKYPPTTTPANTWVYPLDLEIWERTAV
jgi:hypothetical protein